MCEHSRQLLGRARALDEPAEQHHLAAGDGECIHGPVVDHGHTKRVGADRLRLHEPLHDRADGLFAVAVEAAPPRGRDLLHGRLAESLFPGHRYPGGQRARCCWNAPHIENRADRHGGGRRADREKQASPSPPRIVKAAPEAGSSRMQRREERVVVDQEELRERCTALEADLLATVEALGLADLAEGPPEAGAVFEGDLEPARSQADRRRPAGGAPAVEVIARECAGHFLPLRESDVGAQEARERVTGGGRELGLLNDTREVERALDGERRELEARAAHQHPRPCQAERHDEQ